MPNIDTRERTNAPEISTGGKERHETTFAFLYRRKINFLPKYPPKTAQDFRFNGLKVNGKAILKQTEEEGERPFFLLLISPPSASIITNNTSFFAGKRRGEGERGITCFLTPFSSLVRATAGECSIHTLLRAYIKSMYRLPPSPSFAANATYSTFGPSPPSFCG